MTEDEALFLRSRLTIHRQLNPNYCAGAGLQLGHTSRKEDEDDDEDLSDSDKNWDRGSGNVVAKRNARERTRVHTVNQAFLVLKGHLPSLRSHTKRVSKLKILRATINYIDALLELLKKNDGGFTMRGHLPPPTGSFLKTPAVAPVQALADRSLAAPLSYSVNVQSLLDSHNYSLSPYHPSVISAPAPAPPPPQPLLHPFLLNSYHH